MGSAKRKTVRSEARSPPNRKIIRNWNLQASQKKSIRKIEMGGSQKKINDERQFETLEIPRKKINKELELGVPQREKTIRKWILEAPKQKINKRIQL